MEGISSWVLSIAGVCFISVLVDLSLPEGKTNSHIKNVISYVIILVVILPLPNLLKGKFDSDSIFSEIEINIQDEYVYNVNQSKLDALIESINDDLNKCGISGVVVSISANIFEVDMKIYAVYVDLYNVVISGNTQNINIKTEVASVVLNYVNISEDKIIFYE